MRDTDDSLTFDEEGKLASVKTRIVYDAAARAYQNAIKMYPKDPRKAFEQGKRDSSFVFSNVKSVDSSVIEKTLEDHYRRQLGIKKGIFD